MHGIEQHEDGRATFVAVKEHGWHMLGHLSQKDLGVREGLELAHLNDLQHHTVPAFAMVGTEAVAAPGRVACVRRNPFDRAQWDVLGIGASDEYQVHTLEETFAFGEAIIDAGHHLASLGSIDQGRKAFAAFRLDGISVGGQDQVNTFLNVMTSFDRSLSTTARVSTIRVVCQNTLDAVLGQETAPTYKVRHMGDPLESRVQDAREALDVAFAGADAFAKEAERWVQRAVDDAEFDKIVQALYPLATDATDARRTRVGDQRHTFTQFYENSPTVASIKGTAWGALNAWTELVDWHWGSFDSKAERLSAQIVPGTGMDKKRQEGAQRISRVLSLV